MREGRGRLGGWWTVLCTGPILVFCVWPGIGLEGLANAAAGTHRSLSANPCDTLQEIRRKNKDLRKELQKTPWPRLTYFSTNGRSYGLPLRAESRELSQRPAKARLEFLAGFFDGDGCVKCSTNLSGCVLAVGQSYDQAEILMLFREAFGGSITRECGGVGLKKPMLQWQLCGDSARRTARLLAPHSITKQKQLLIAARWPKTKSRREDRKAELCALKNYDSAVAGSCSWSYFAGFFDAEGYIKQQRGGASLVLEVKQKYPTVLKCLGGFLSRSLGIDASLRQVSASPMMHVLRTFGLLDFKRILQHMHQAGLVRKAEQAELAQGLTKQNAARVFARLTCLTGNQKFGKTLNGAGHERARRIKNEQTQAAYWKRRGRLAEAENKKCEVAVLKEEHETIGARHENQQLLQYICKLQSLHDNSWNGPLAQGM